MLALENCPIALKNHPGEGAVGAAERAARLELPAWGLGVERLVVEPPVDESRPDRHPGLEHRQTTPWPQAAGRLRHEAPRAPHVVQYVDQQDRPQGFRRRREAAA